jgi:hypothetical protein
MSIARAAPDPRANSLLASRLPYVPEPDSRLPSLSRNGHHEGKPVGADG